eukprot:Skav204542  [mRNA]  locus=scaffold3346:47009:56623:- [translate_table: standard]
MSDADVSPDGEPPPEEAPPKASDYAQGYAARPRPGEREGEVGYIYEDAFRELYAEKPPDEADAAEPDPAEGGAEDPAVASGAFVRDDGEIDLNKEKGEGSQGVVPFRPVPSQVFSEQERLEQIQKLLLRKIDEAREGDQQELTRLESLSSSWAVQGKLKEMLDRGQLEREQLIVPFTPDVVLFRNYEIGGLYQIQVEFRNCTGISRRLRILPCTSAAFSIKELHYDKDAAATASARMILAFPVGFPTEELNSQRPELVGLDPLAAVVAPGLAAHLVVPPGDVTGRVPLEGGKAAEGMAGKEPTGNVDI